jgi:hydroxymethylpyrimidine/phosphomethylpyrimidine kinase
MGDLTPPKLLTIAGSDSGGGAGIQADLKTFLALGCYGMSVITALTAQNTVTVKSIHPVPAPFIADQLAAIFEDMGVDALKLGMLHSVQNIETVARFLRCRPSIPSVLDPVMVAKGGSKLLEPTAIEAMRTILLPFVTVLTPNLPEAEILLGRTISTRAEMENAAQDLLAEVEVVVIKGGHLLDKSSPDFLASRSGEREWIEYPRIATKNTHGTGCTFSAAIAAFLGLGKLPLEAVLKAREFLQSAIVSGARFKLGHGSGPVDHAVNLRSSRYVL